MSPKKSILTFPQFLCFAAFSSQNTCFSTIKLAFTALKLSEMDSSLNQGSQTTYCAVFGAKTRRLHRIWSTIICQNVTSKGATCSEFFFQKVKFENVKIFDNFFGLQKHIRHAPKCFLINFERRRTCLLILKSEFTRSTNLDLDGENLRVTYLMWSK